MTTPDPDTSSADPSTARSSGDAPSTSEETTGEATETRSSTAPDEPAGQMDEDDLEAIAEPHRAFVRMIDRSFSRVYAAGGTAVLLISGGIIGARWWFGGLWQLSTWLMAITTALAILMIVRWIVPRRARSLRSKLESYCRTNDVSIDALRTYYRRRDLYPYFDAIFDVLERRDDLDGSGAQSNSDDGDND